MDFISVTENKFDLFSAKNIQQVLYLAQGTIGFYDFKWLDTSQISIYDFGQDFYTYIAAGKDVNSLINDNNQGDIFECWIVQSRSYTETTWSINSLDLILGLVGGITSIIWGCLGIIIAPYEDFKFQNSVAGSMYPTSPQKDEDEREHDNSSEA